MIPRSHTMAGGLAPSTPPPFPDSPPPTMGEGGGVHVEEVEAESGGRW